MAKQNLVFLYGRVMKAPLVSKNQETGEYTYGMVYIDTVRGKRSVGDDLRFVKHDSQIIMSREKEHLDNMVNWKENDIIYVKGVISTQRIQKSSYCPDCKNEDGKPVKNETVGNLIYVTPVYMEKMRECPDKNTAIEDIITRREISNLAYIYGTLLRDPQIFTTKKKIQITQYPIAINRKLTIRTDDPSIKTDWPIVKSYGEQARDDKIFLQAGAEVIIDGFVQARTITRKATCKCCGKIYPWSDHAMEIVPYAVEYVTGNKSKEEVEAEAQRNVEDLKQMLFNNSSVNDDLEDDLKSDDIENDA